jgi:hypothetical protein
MRHDAGCKPEVRWRLLADGIHQHPMTILAASQVERQQQLLVSVPWDLTLAKFCLSAGGAWCLSLLRSHARICLGKRDYLSACNLGGRRAFHYIVFGFREHGG